MISNTTSPNTDLHINSVGIANSNTPGATTSASETIIYTFPSGYVGGSCYLNTLPWSTGGYADCFVCKSSNSSDEVFTTRLNAHNSFANLSNNGNYDGVRVDCVASGYNQYDQLKIKVRKGKLHLMGLGFTTEIDRPVASIACVHSDNVIGDPSSLSDTRLKQNQAIVPPATLVSIFDAIETKEYDLISTGVDTEGNALPAERRVGFIADEVKAVIPEASR